jgi:GDPmannose 4,6-dehydratase
VTVSVRQFAEWAFEEAGIAIDWQGSGVDERGYDRASGKCLVQVDPRYYRPTEVELLLGDASKAREVLGWTATTGVRDLVREMVRADLDSNVPAGRLSDV